MKDKYKKMTTAEWIVEHNWLCCDTSCMDEYIYSMSELDETLEDYTPEEIVRIVHYGKFNPTDKYFWFNSDGNLKSGSQCHFSETINDFISDFDFTPVDIIKELEADE